MIFSPLDGEAKRVSPAPPNVVVWPHSAEPLRRGSFTTHAAAAEGGGNFFWGNSISCQQHPAVRKLRDADVVDGGENAHAGESRTRRGRRNEDAVDGGDGESLTAVTAVTAPAVSVEAYGRSRRAPDASVMKSGTFLLGALRNDRNADGMLAALHGQHIKGKLRTDHLPQIPSGPLTRDKAELETKQRSSDSGAAPDAVRPISRYALRVSGYPASSGGTSIGTIKPIASRPQRQPMQRSVMPARPSATHYQETISKLELSAVGINAQQGAKAALDSCRIPLDLLSLKGEEDGLRKINRSTRGLTSQRGELAETHLAACSSGNSRASDSVSGELVVCNSQKVEETDLVFMSQFESGNLLSAQRVGPEEYDLQLQVDNATSGHTQWFYFCVSNTFPGVQYRLNIINFAKPDSLYTRGQQPLFFSLLSSKKENAGWRRIGRDIRYFRNGRKRNGKTLFTLSFLVEFAYAKDKCLFAHCYPYTYTELQDYINKMLHQPFSRNLLTSHHLCTTLGGNVCPVLTITSPQGSEEEIKARKVIFVSSRVHPGESNSSWIMKGLLDFLLGQSVEAELLRFRFIFKILPMLNPDGVINGHYRCNLAGYDLNRHWHDPDRNVHPTIFHAKDLLRNLQRDQEVVMFCDIHGHSVKHNLFLYGCPKAKPESATARMQPDGEPFFHDFPNVLNFASSFFSMPDSRFVIEKIKEHTGRVVAWRELGIANSFTLEASLCGSGEGKSQCTAQFTCDDFEAMGRSFGVSLALASSETLFQSVRDDPELLRNMLLSHTDSDEAWESRGETHNRANQPQPSMARMHTVAAPHEDTNALSIAEFRSSPPNAPPATSPAVSAVAEAGQNTTYRQAGQNISDPHTTSASAGESASASASVNTIASVNTSLNTSANTSVSASTSASASPSPRRRVAAVNNKTGPHPNEATPMRDLRDTALCGAHIAPTLRFQPSQHAVSRQAQTAQREAEIEPKEIPPSAITSLATDGEDESSSDDERNEDEDAAGFVCLCVCCLRDKAATDKKLRAKPDVFARAVACPPR